MTESVPRAASFAAERVTDGAGVVTLVAGTALVLAPGAGGSALGLGDRHDRLRALGLADLVLGPGLLAGRPRWPWMAARAGLNLVVARLYRAQLRDHPDLRKARVGAAAMTTLTLVDGAVAGILAATRR